jgi:hypothetical protein
MNTYNATIPASDVTTAIIEYYINATDGTNFATYPASNPDTSPSTIDVNLFPSQVTANQPTDITDTAMSIIWTQSPDTDFQNYTVFQSETSGIVGSPVYSITNKTLTYYNATGLNPNKTYYFTVRVYDAIGLYTDSNQVSATTLTHIEEAPFPWVPVSIGITVAAAATVVALLVIRRRKKK